VEKLDAQGLGAYPKIAGEYVERQRTNPKAFLPPTRFLYIFCSATWRAAFYGDAGYHRVESFEDVKNDPTLKSMRAVSALFTCLSLLVGAVFARRLAGDSAMLGVTALLACAPTQLHMAQHGLIDGFFAFWALTSAWLLWENLQTPNHAGRLLAYGASLAFMVLTKENAAFVTVALCVVIATAYFAKWGKVTRNLLLVTVVGPATGLCILIALAGGVGVFIETYRLLVTRAEGLAYAIATGDGPWYRYLVDLMLASPLILLLAVGTVFQLRSKDHGLLYVTAFIAGSYVFMCNVKYGMNLRYANMWDMPLRLLAFTQVGLLAARFPARWNSVALGAFVVGLCAFDLHQYQVLFVNFDKDYEMITTNLLYALKILKVMSGN
jgi:4-amino-4-deoxy-L-arabinose transferase-like glycosyltransferase